MAIYRQRRLSHQPHLEQLECRRLLAGLGSTIATITEGYRDFVFDVRGVANGTNTIAQPAYSDRYQAEITSATGRVQFTSPTTGSGSGTGTARITGRDNFGSYAYVADGAASGTVNNGVLSNVQLVPALPAGVAVSGTFNPLTWAVQTNWSGRDGQVVINGGFTGSVSQSLPKTDFLASVVFETTQADAIHDSTHSVRDVADAVRATVTIDVVGQHMRAATMGSTVTTAEIFLGPVSNNRPLVDPIPIHWNTGRITVELSHFLNQTSPDGTLHVVFDRNQVVSEADETNNDLALPIPYDIVAVDFGWLPSGSALGAFRIAVPGLNSSTLPNTRATVFFADATGKYLDANPTTVDIIDPLSDRLVGGLSQPEATTGDFLIGTVPLTTRPDGTTQLILEVDGLIIPQNAEINETNNALSLPLTEISLSEFAFTAQGTLELALQIQHMPLIRDTTADLYWATGDADNYSLLNRIQQFPLQTGSLGEVPLTPSPAALAVPPPSATAVVLVVDPKQTGFPLGLILEPDENNTFFLERLDFGDAPAIYPVSLAANGARHVIGPLFLGSSVTPESDGLSSAAADRDRGDDGVVPVGQLSVDPLHPTLAKFRVTASQAGKLDAWIDFNHDGDWTDPGEQIARNLAVQSGENELPFLVPAGALAGNSFARFRISEAGSLSPTGRASSGEVEDYSFPFVAGTANVIVFYQFDHDLITLSHQDSNTVLTSRGNLLLSRPTAEVGSIELVGGAADQVVTLDFGSGFVVPAGGLKISGAGGSNTIQILGDQARLDLTDAKVVISDFASLSMPATSASSVAVNAGSISRLSPVNKNLQITGGPTTKIEVQSPSQWRLRDPRTQNGHVWTTASSLLAGQETIQADLSRGWHNFVQPSDVNNDGWVNGLDALIVINELNRQHYSLPVTARLFDSSSIAVWPGLYFDQNADNHVSALDALRAINDIPDPQVRFAESEPTVPAVASLASPPEMTLNTQRLTDELIRTFDFAASMRVASGTPGRATWRAVSDSIEVPARYQELVPPDDDSVDQVFSAALSESLLSNLG